MEFMPKVLFYLALVWFAGEIVLGVTHDMRRQKEAQMAIDQRKYGPGNGVVFGRDMRRDHRRRAGDREVSTGVLTLIMMLLLLGIGMMIGYGWRAYVETPEPRRVAVVQPTGAEKRWIEQRHRYHGIWASIEENGEHYFIRDGKRCKL